MLRLRPEWDLAVERVVVGFHQDKHDDWVADLDCGHGRHMRHQPPWMVREWVLTKEGRLGFVGHKLDCTKCEEPPSRPEASNQG